AVHPSQPGRPRPGEHHHQRRQGEPRRHRQGRTAEAEPPQHAANRGEEEAQGGGFHGNRQGLKSLATDGSPSPGPQNSFSFAVPPGTTVGSPGFQSRAATAAEGTSSVHSVTHVSSLYVLRTFSATFWASGRELKGPIRTRYMVWPATSTGD